MRQKYRIRLCDLSSLAVENWVLLNEGILVLETKCTDCILLSNQSSFIIIWLADDPPNTRGIVVYARGHDFWLMFFQIKITIACFG